MTTAAQYAANPDKYRAQSRARYARYRQDPEFLARKAADQARRRSDPAYREAAAERKRRFAAANPELARARRQASHQRWRYGVTADQYEAMLIAQAGRCAICRTVPGYRLVIDHDHSDGRVRGLLCKPCNFVLSLAKDDPDRLRSAADYLGAPVAVAA